MVRHPALLARARVWLPGAARGMRLGEQVDLGATEAEPRAVEHEVRRPRHLLEPERVAVERARPVEVGDDEPDVLDPHRHRPYRNLAPLGKETECR